MPSTSERSSTEPSVHPRAFLHWKAVVDLPCAVGEATRIWHFCHVMAGAWIGARSVLGQNVLVAATAEVGDGVHITQPNGAPLRATSSASSSTSTTRSRWP